MTMKEKLALLEEMLNVEEGTLNEQMGLDEIAEWDSLAAISLIALLDEEFGRNITAKEIKQFKTVQDILKVME